MRKYTATNVVDRIPGGIDPVLEIQNRLINIPEVFRAKQDFLSLDASGELRQLSHIHPALGHILNSQNYSDDVRKNELARSLSYIDKEISKLIKKKVLTKRVPGYMAFSQSSENVPKGALYINRKTFRKLCEYDKRWETTSTVYCIRYPNLGPNTTTILRLCVEGSSLASSFNLDSVKGFFEETEDTCGAMWLNPENLKGHLEGDGDGDLVYAVPYGSGYPRELTLSWDLEPSEITESALAVMEKKYNYSRPPIATYLPTYFDTPLISPVTYACRWKLHNRAKMYSDERQPMFKAWQEISPWAIDRTEFSMDMRKGEFTAEQINKVFAEIQGINDEIKSARDNGNWFAKTVTTSTITDIPGFIERFSGVGSLTSYLNYITSGSIRPIAVSGVQEVREGHAVPVPVSGLDSFESNLTETTNDAEAVV